MTDDDPKHTSDTTTTIRIPWIPLAVNAGDVYSNFLHLNWTLHDVRIRFGQIIPDPSKQPETAEWAVKEMAVVTMPWGQAKVLRDMLTAAIKKFEDINGEITTPEMPT